MKKLLAVLLELFTFVTITGCEANQTLVVYT